MKKTFFVVLALALPVFAAEPETPPTNEPAVETSQEMSPDDPSASECMGPTAPLPYCWNLEGTACSFEGSTTYCTDGIYTDYVCTCKRTTSGRVWDCPEVR